METRKNDKLALVKILLLTAAAFVLYLKSPHIDLQNNILNDFVSELEKLACCVGAALLAQKLGVLKPTGKGFTAGLAAGSYFVLMIVIKLVQWGVQLMTGKTDIGVPAGSIVIFLIYCLVIGISEELLFRGVLLEGLFDYFGNGSTRALRRAVIIAGCCFGAAHLCNIKDSSTIAIGIATALANMSSGVLFGAVYLRGNRNIWPCILLHSLIDCSLYLNDGILSAAVTAPIEVLKAEASLPQIIGVLVVAACDFAIAMTLMQDKKILPFVNDGADAKTVIRKLSFEDLSGKSGRPNAEKIRIRTSVNFKDMDSAKARVKG